MQDELRNASNPKWFRQVLGQYPTGVCVISAITPDGKAAGMAVGSFTSVSLDPPLVAFLPDKSSTSWPKIESAKKFCVSILGADQEDVCRRFASKMPDKFEGLSYRMSTLGSPIINGCVAWMDCEQGAIYEAGDHYIVLGAVHELQIETGSLPLLFFQGGYGQFKPLSLVAPDPLGVLSVQLRNVENAREQMNIVAGRCEGRCIATAVIEDEIVIAASSGSPRRGSVPSLVGQRFPFMPPTTSVFAAWSSDIEQSDWLAKSKVNHKEVLKTSLEKVRQRGFSVGLLSDEQRKFASKVARLANGEESTGDDELQDLIANLKYDPDELTPQVLNDIRLISVPVFGKNREVLFALTLYEFARPPQDKGIVVYIKRLMDSAEKITDLLGGVRPEGIGLSKDL
ncbi:flavin reductase [Limnobacter sp. UBA7229]|uniref:flavin reductase n=1 Tax=Limnobacter sp. UBA7229 TaxID=1946762 RepID=UPI000C6AD1EA|nr:flavin reductase [Limnobacter sp. UBA7229]MAG81389.1 flavin reductase [Sutterellaceae bacterium]|tara:strand:+ start:30561 stop:31754 length:1194 start_codon:yes stop_codon:yes gene_type:complete